MAQKQLKIGILTFHQAHNYGAVLQAYALQEYIKSMGHDVYIIDYKPQWMSDYCNWFHPRVFRRKNIFIPLFHILKRKRRYDKFNRFINKKLILSSELDTSHYDVVVVGSDQVWNTDITHGYDSYYWGDKKGNFITYAASTGKYNFNEEEKRTITKKLSNFKHISVRDSATVESIQKLTNKKVHTVLDPTLLVESEFWKKQVSEKYKGTPYLLFYQVEKISGMMEYAKNIAKQLNLKLKVLSVSALSENSKECINACPNDYISLFKNASYIIATSFHGTVFSIIFSRPFYAVKVGTEKDVRFISLLKQVGLLERAIKLGDSLVDSPINWDDVHDRLSIFRKESKEYFMQSI